jgi:hydrogenase maturation protein HypF
MPTTKISDLPIRHARQYLLQGMVQGMGVRPSVVRLAQRCGVFGFVKNTSDGVCIHAETASHESLQRFDEQLSDAASPGSILSANDCVPTNSLGVRDFRILPSEPHGSVRTLVPPDLAMCRACRKDIAEGLNRRRAYAFTSCTACGPRYSILQSIPYERHATAMAPFELCRACRGEFKNVGDRRFHAQTNACPVCGPRLTRSRAQRAVAHEALSDGDILNRAAEVIRAGGIVALKGLGGYQLLCDAASDATTQRLRQGKRRPSKPLAVMIDSDCSLGNFASSATRLAFESPENPIVLVDDSAVVGLSSSVNPGISTLGILRPTTPMHQIILSESDRPLVVTSGNVDGEPLAYETAVAEEQLSSIADLIVHHDRQIIRPVDDSVVRVIANRTVTIRCGRGIAPLPLPVDTKSLILAVGGNQKVAVALSNGAQAVLGPHIGNMSSVASRERFEQEVAGLQDLYGMTASVIAHDLHPDYFTSQWATGRGVRTIPVQHHHAHVAAGMLEHGLPDETVLGVAFDGTGYGTDNTVWGGEFLLATSEAFRRIGRLVPFSLPGSEAVAHEPWRTAVSLLVACEADIDDAVVRMLRLDERQLSSVRSIKNLVLSSQSPLTSSMGRLFDAVAALVLGRPDSSFEGESAMRLEAACDESASGSYDLTVLRTDGRIQLCWKAMLNTVLHDLKTVVPVGTIAMRFHRGVAQGVAAVAGIFPEYPVVLTGGCFQNRVLTELVEEMLAEHPASVFGPGRIPPNDGGLAAGQLVVAAAILRREQLTDEVQ